MLLLLLLHLLLLKVLEQRIDQLTTDKDRLMAEVTHGKQLQHLFANVTSKTNEVQQAANEVMLQVEAARRTRSSKGLEIPFGEMDPGRPLKPRALVARTPRGLVR